VKPIELIKTTDIGQPDRCKNCKPVKGDKFACMLEQAYSLTYDNANFSDLSQYCTVKDYASCPLNVI